LLNGILFLPQIVAQLIQFVGVFQRLQTILELGFLSRIGLFAELASHVRLMFCVLAILELVLEIIFCSRVFCLLPCIGSTLE
jgi:hypothetical protein